MIRITMTTLLSSTFCLAVVCGALRAQAQSNTGASAESNRGIDAVDASVHSEVDAHPHELNPADASNEHLTPLHNTKRPPVTVVWPARADLSITDSDNKSGLPRVGMSSFRTKAGSGQPSASVTSTGATNHDSGQDDFRLLKASPRHPLPLSARPSLSTRTTVPLVSGSDQTPAFVAPFGRTALGFAASASPFPKRDPFKSKNQTTGKRHQHQESKPLISTETKSSFDSLATTRR